jgi:hypothetical protein
MNMIQVHGFRVKHLTLTVVALPRPHAVLVRLESVDLNAQDLLLVQEGYVPNLTLPSHPQLEWCWRGSDPERRRNRLADRQLGTGALYPSLATGAGHAGRPGLHDRPHAPWRAGRVYHAASHRPGAHSRLSAHPKGGHAARWRAHYLDGSYLAWSTAVGSNGFTQGTGGAWPLPPTGSQVGRDAGIATTGQDTTRDRLRALGANEVWLVGASSVFTYTHNRD